MDFTSVQVHLHILQRLNAGKALADALQLQEFRTHLILPSLSGRYGDEDGSGPQIHPMLPRSYSTVLRLQLSTTPIAQMYRPWITACSAVGALPVSFAHDEFSVRSPTQAHGSP